jgi:hypothetical protein
MALEYSVPFVGVCKDSCRIIVTEIFQNSYGYIFL